MNRYLIKSGIGIAMVAGVLLYMLTSMAWAIEAATEDVSKIGAAAPNPPPLLKITTPGLHRLMGNLNVNTLNRNAVEIDASNVTLDLNGYTISGPAVCSGSPVTCSTGTGVGVYIPGVNKLVNITVMNGTIVGMSDYAISNDISTSGIHVERLNVGGNGHGMLVNGGTVNNCVVEQNGGSGITGNGLLITGNLIGENNGFGIDANYVSGYSNNVLLGNTLGNVSGATQMGANLCNGAACP